MCPKGKTTKNRELLKKPVTKPVERPINTAIPEDEPEFEGFLLLPPPHSRPQNNLINAWDLKHWQGDPNFKADDPLKTSYTEDQWNKQRLKNPNLPKWEAITITFPQLKFVVGACGTKFGKTYGCAIRICKEAWEHPKSLNWWVAPTYNQAENAYNKCLEILPTGTYRVQFAKLRITLLYPDGSDRSSIEFKSGDKPEGLRGFAVHFFIIDEAAQGMPEAAWISVQTTITQTDARGIIISTPNGGGWFQDEYEKGVKYWEDGTPKYNADNPDPWPEYFSVCMPTHANPHVKLEVVEFKRRTLPHVQFQQEYLAKFVTDANNVFENNTISGCTRGSWEEYIPGKQYVIGVDLARLKDFTVLTVVRRDTKHVVAVYRFNKVSWDYNKKKIIEIAQQYGNAQCVMDTTGVGDAIYDDLSTSGIHIFPYKIHGNDPKRILIEKLMVTLEGRRLSFPAATKEHPDLYFLHDELKTYERKLTASGVVQYQARSNKHDDCVISIALANMVVDTAPFVYKHKRIAGM
jgi:hypothetical protein